MKNSLTDIIKAKIQEADYERLRKEWNFWPSEASCLKKDGTLIGKCLRQLYYDWFKLPQTNPVPDRVKLLGEIGHFVEYRTRKELLAKKLYSLDLNKKENRKFKVLIVDDIILSGEIDIIAGNDDEHCGMEIKNYSNSSHQLYGGPKDPHLLQTFLYSVFYEPRQPYFLIKYCPSMISKYATKEIYHRIDWMEVDNDIYPVVNGGINKNISLNEIIKRYKEAKYYIKNKYLPCRDYIRSSTQCKQCVYRDYCKTDSEGTKLR